MSRPKVVTFNVASLDGRVAASRDRLLIRGDERWQALGEAGDAYRWLKSLHAPQASLEGSGSLVREEDEPAPLPPVEGDAAHLYDDYLPQSVTGRAGHRGWFTVVDGRGRVRNWIKDGGVFGEEWQGWHTLVLVCQATPAPYLAYLQREAIPYLVAGAERVDLSLALEKVGARLGVTTLLSTAAGRLNGALLRAGLVHEVNVELLPGIVGGMDTPSLFDSPALGPEEKPVRLELISALVATGGAGGQVWLRYRPLL
jgi:2,5-diamino-6-(ribosylamino)-4(3H)-pyrimidinone 5'-phosphate reductase